jgi:cysteine desulfurase
MSDVRVIYLDNNATTQPLPSVVVEMTAYLTEKWGNPSSAHAFGLTAKAGLDCARRSVADLVGADPATVVFTSSATEANNTAISSALRGAPRQRRIVTAATEHSAVITFGRTLEGAGHEFVLVKPLPSGVIDLHALAEAINGNTAVVSIMWANNETGVINPIAEIAALCRERGVLFHCDAVQAAGKLPIDLRAVSVDYLTLSAHKIHGPKGIGALIVAPNVPFVAMMYGGHQEKGRRAGTENVPAAVGFAKAAALATAELDGRARQVAVLRDRLENRILAEVLGTEVNGLGAPRLPNTTNIGFAGVDSDTLVSVLDQGGVCVSSGSACLSDTVAPSHVILAMTDSHQKASEAIRFSLSHLNTADEIECAVATVKQAVKTLR